MNKLKKYYGFKSIFEYNLISKHIILYDIHIANKGYIIEHFILKGCTRFGIKIDILKMFDNEKK